MFIVLKLVEIIPQSIHSLYVLYTNDNPRVEGWIILNMGWTNLQDRSTYSWYSDHIVQQPSTPLNILYAVE